MKENTIQCPHCNGVVSLSLIPEEQFKSERGRRNALLVRRHPGPRPFVWKEHRPDIPWCACRECVLARTGRAWKRARERYEQIREAVAGGSVNEEGVLRNIREGFQRMFQVLFPGEMVPEGAELAKRLDELAGLAGPEGKK